MPPWWFWGTHRLWHEHSRCPRHHVDMVRNLHRFGRTVHLDRFLLLVDQLDPFLVDVPCWEGLSVTLVMFPRFARAIERGVHIFSLAPVQTYIMDDLQSSLGLLIAQSTQDLDLHVGRGEHQCGKTPWVSRL